jgi:hypothetical protein
MPLPAAPTPCGCKNWGSMTCAGWRLTCPLPPLSWCALLGAPAPPQTSRLQNLPNLVRMASAWRLPVRITESATLSYGGVRGISDTAGAALWAVDTALEAALAGAAGIHFHQVLAQSGNANYNAIDFHATSSRVRAKLPFWGYMLLQQALSGGADILSRAISGECKVWLLKGRKTGGLRAVVLNKSAKGHECGADIKLNADQMRRYSSEANAYYMWASRGIWDSWRIYYSGAYFGEWGSSKQGKEMVVPVARYAAPDGSGGFAVHLTMGTIAALIDIPPAGAGSGLSVSGVYNGAASAPASAPSVLSWFGFGGGGGAGGGCNGGTGCV